MEETANSTFFTFDSPKGQSSYIKVIGVGGGGGNAVNHMYDKGIEGVDFIVCNTDMKALNASPVPNKIPLGDLGLGAGNKPERAREAAEKKADDIREAISHNTQMLFITAGMGGGTGTGAAPVIAEIAKSIDLENDENKKILVVAIVTRPFSFEGQRRRAQAEAGIEELRKHVDSIIVINNDKLRSFGNMRISEAFGMADDVLLTAAKGIAEIITKNAYVNRDFQDVNTVMEHSGTALMGTGSGSGENRALEAITAATTSVLLDDSDINGAKNVLLYFSYSREHEMTIDEQTEITDFVIERTGGSADVIWGAGADDSLGDELKVILIATGFEKSRVEPEEPKVFKLAPELPVEEAKPVVEQKADEEGMELIHRDEPAPFVIEDVVAAPKPAAEKHVFVLDEEPTLEVARETAEAQVEVKMPEVDLLVEDIHIVDRDEAAQPVAEVVAAPQVEVKPAEPVYKSAFRNDNDLATVADRIKHIHELLRNSANGADIVQGMPTSQITEEALFEGRSSSMRESSTATLRPDGRMVQNPYFRDQAD
ncbi:MAG: cell division protein FtsZ [Bacteroidales bacterium]|nr:cell division protein FtsZ [Bacteroidales bacterium]